MRRSSIPCGINVLLFRQWHLSVLVTEGHEAFQPKGAVAVLAASWAASSSPIGVRELSSEAALTMAFAISSRPREMPSGDFG